MFKDIRNKFPELDKFEKINSFGIERYGKTYIADTEIKASAETEEQVIEELRKGINSAISNKNIGFVRAYPMTYQREDEMVGARCRLAL